MPLGSREPLTSEARFPKTSLNGKLASGVVSSWKLDGVKVGLENGQGYNSTRYSELAPDNSQNPPDIAGSALGKGLGCTWQQYQYNYQRISAKTVTPTAADPKRALVRVKEKLGIADKAFNTDTKIVSAKPHFLSIHRP